MINLFEAAEQLQAFCDQRSWRSCFIGGIAVQRWGEPPVTRDIDFLTAYSARIPDARELDIRDAEGVAIRNRDQIDWQYVQDQLRPLAEIKDPAILQTLSRIRVL